MLKDVHLMIENPDRWAPGYAEAGAYNVTFHAEATDNPVDDMSDFCVDRGWNLEFTLVRREGFPAPGGTSVEATCQLSQNKAIDCPELP